MRADVPAEIQQGLGSEYVRYDGSACAMRMVMHYFGGAPFKRLESLHQGWGVPLPDANQWEVVNAGDDLLLPLAGGGNVVTAILVLIGATALSGLVKA